MEDKYNMADTGCLALKKLGLANHVVLAAHRFSPHKRKVTGSTQNLLLMVAVSSPKPKLVVEMLPAL